MKLAILYAGQGSQHPGMGKDLYERYPAFREAFDAADLDFDLRSVCFDDPEGVLNLTQYTQPCMVAFAAGVTAVLKENGVKADDLAGLSLGEYSALEAAGVFTAKQAVELAAFRGRAMADAAKGNRVRHDRRDEPRPRRTGKVLRGGLCSGLRADLQLQLPGPAGHRRREGRSRKGRRAGESRRCPPLHPPEGQRPLPHPPDAPRRDALAKRFEAEHFGEMETPVLFNCLGHEKAESDTIPALLEKQVQSSVYMEDTLRRLGELGVTDILEVGPGKALSGFVKRRWEQMSAALLSRRQKNWKPSSPAGRRHRHERRKS